MMKQCRRVVRFLPLHLGSLSVILYVFLRGSDYNYDLVNIRGQLAWSILRGRLGIDTQIGGRYAYPPFNDVLNVLLLGTGHWWLPVLFWGFINAMIVPLSFLIIKEIAPKMNFYVQQCLALASLTSPIILMQIGTSFGHLTTSVFIGLSLLYVLRGRISVGNRDWLLAGSFLAVAMILRNSNVPTFPAYALAISFISINSLQFFSFLVAFGSVFLSVSGAWAWFASRQTGTDFVGLEVVPFGTFGFFAAFSLLLLLMLFSKVNRPLITKMLRFLNLRSAVAVTRAVLFAAIIYMVRKVYLMAEIGDPRFLITDANSALQRIFHTGSLVDKCCQVDLEYSYFDLRIQVAFGLLILFLVSLFFDHSDQVSKRLGISLFITLPLLMPLAYSGYVRYGSQALPYVPLGVALLASTSRLKVVYSRCFLFLGLLILVAPVVPGFPYSRDIPRYAQLGGRDELFSRQELLQVNSLLPEGSYVYIAGKLTSILAQQLNRPDLVWTWKVPESEDVLNGSQRYFALYSPSEPLTVEQLPAHMNKSECGVLRFRSLGFTICRLVAK
jgi:hypothetical protein